VGGYEHRIDDLDLPDENDRHVLAAALECGAHIILTFNLRHFPPAALPTGIAAVTPTRCRSSSRWQIADRDAAVGLLLAHRICRPMAGFGIIPTVGGP
jgi:hypothetical protein